MKKHIFQMIQLLPLIFLFACGESSPTFQGTPTLPESLITVIPNSVTVPKGSTFRFSHSFLFNETPTVTWTISGNTSDDTGIYNGFLIVATDETATTMMVTASSIYYYNPISGTATVNVKP